MVYQLSRKSRPFLLKIVMQRWRASRLPSSVISPDAIVLTKVFCPSRTDKNISLLVVRVKAGLGAQPSKEIMVPPSTTA